MTVKLSAKITRASNSHNKTGSEIWSYKYAIPPRPATFIIQLHSTRKILTWSNGHNKPEDVVYFLNQFQCECSVTFRSFLCAFMFRILAYCSSSPVNSKIASMSRAHKHGFQLWSRHVQKPSAQQNQIALWKTFFRQMITPQMSWDILITITKTFQIILTHKFPTSSSILEEHEARHFATVCWHTYACYLSTKRGKTCEDRVHYLVVSEASILRF